MAIKSHITVPEFSKILKKWATENNYKTPQIYNKILESGLPEIKEQSINGILSAEQNPTAIQIKVFSQITGISTDELLGLRGPGLFEHLDKYDPDNEIVKTIQDLDIEYGGRRSAYIVLLALKSIIQFMQSQEEHPFEKMSFPQSEGRDITHNEAQTMKDTLLRRVLGNVKKTPRKKN